MDAKCIAICNSLCPIRNITEESRCRMYEAGRTEIISPYLQYLCCPIHKSNKINWKKVKSEEETK